MFAEVAVNRRVRGTFHYHIPAELIDQIAPGHLVEIAFGTAYTTGIVIALHAASPVPKTKPIRERLDPLPVVTPTQIALARWISAETLAPLGPCLWLMLPPGLAKPGGQRYSLVESEIDDTAQLSPTQKRLLSLLQRRGPLRGKQLDHALPRTRWRGSMNALIKRGLVHREAVLDRPDVKPKVVRTVRLVIPPERVDDVALRLGRESRRANVLEVLLAYPRRRLSLSAILMAVGCTDAPVKVLAESGDVRIETRQTWVELALPSQHVAARLAGGQYERAPAQRGVLEALLNADGPVASDQLNASALRTLETAGTVRRWTEPATVELYRSEADTRQRIIDLRGGQPQLDVLRFLAANDDAQDVKTVCAQTGADLAKLRQLAEDGLVVLGEAETWRDPLAERDFVPTLPPPLTGEQALVWNEI
ncbi:MAG: hypothetical protein JW966_03410, partial [Anaerolineae bacterium]|nr:hypothetical protein [Anaerolineae bacterium]